MGPTDDQVVLLVDDEADLLEVHQTILGETFEVLPASDGAEALELMDDSIDVVLVDRQMPEMRGEEVVERLRDRGYDVPVGMLSAVKPERDIFEIPIDDYLAKPIDPETLVKRTELLAIRTGFDQRCRAFIRFASKKYAIETTDSPTPNDTEAIQELVTWMEALRENAPSQTNPLSARGTTPPSVDIPAEQVLEDFHSPDQTN